MKTIIKNLLQRQKSHVTKKSKNGFFGASKNIKILLFLVGLFGILSTHIVLAIPGPTILSPGDIVLVTANADSPDSFEFVTRVDLEIGTVIYFTDNALNGNNTLNTNEGHITFIATKLIPAGKTLMINSANSASSISLLPDSSRGTVERSNNFDLAAAGDNIFVYQGDTINTSHPVFIYGLGWGSSSPRITNGTPTSNNSYIPTILTIGKTIGTNTSTFDNIQYNCTNVKIRSNDFLSDISNANNRLGDNTTLYGPISCIFDTTNDIIKPQILSIDLADGQTNPTSGNTIKFLVTFSEEIDIGSFDCSDVNVYGDAICNTITPIIATTFEIIIDSSIDGGVFIEIEGGKIKDLAGNFNDNEKTSDEITVDTSGPIILETTPIPTLSCNPRPSYTFNSNESGIITYGGSCNSATMIAEVGNNTIIFNELVEGTYNDCTITVMDNVGNISNTLSINEFTIDRTLPLIEETQQIPDKTNNTTPNYTFTTDKIGLNVSYEGDCSSETENITSLETTITFYELSEGEHNNCVIKVVDPSLPGLIGTLNVSSFTIDTIAPSISNIQSNYTANSNIAPKYTFDSNEKGIITYGGSCSNTSSTTIAVVGSNSITLNEMSDGTYNDCILIVTDTAGNISNELLIPEFTIDTIAPSIYEVTPIITPSTNQNPEYIFSSDESGIIIYGGSCSSATSTAILGHNNIVMDILNIGIYNDCTITITDNAGNISNELLIPEFNIKQSLETSEETEVENNKGVGTSTKLIKDICPNGDISPSYYDGFCGIEINEEIKKPRHGSAKTKRNETRINRIELAKSVVFFAKEVLELEPNIEKPCIFLDIKNENKNNQLIIEQACQLNLMGVQQNGITSAEIFRPQDTVTRNEFITTLSRLLFGEKNNLIESSGEFYKDHTLALEKVDLLNYIPKKITQAITVNILRKIYEKLNIIES